MDFSQLFSAVISKAVARATEHPPVFDGCLACLRSTPGR